MNPHSPTDAQTPVPQEKPHACKVSRAVSGQKRREREGRFAARPLAGLPSGGARLLLLTLLAAVSSVALYAATAAAFSGARAFVRTPHSSSSTGAREASQTTNLLTTNLLTTNVNDLIDATGAGPLGMARDDARAAARFAPAMPFFSSETVATFAADCTTPKNDFNLGETVCARVTGAPLSFFLQRRLLWVNPAGIVASAAFITTDPQTVQFTIPSSPTSNISGITVDNRGAWRLSLVSYFEGFVQTRTTFGVHEQGNPSADLSVVSSTLQTTVGSASSVAFQILVSNLGPDAAQNVQLTDEVPAHANFVSSAQESGPVFTCGGVTPGGVGTTTCTITSLAPGAVAAFTFVYQVDRGTAAGTLIENTANVSSATTETHEADNASSAVVTVIASPCVVSCPGNIRVDADAGQSGAVVNFTPPVATGDCGQTATGEDGETIQPVSCSRESGSFFPAGTTPVSCVGQTGDACTFLVTVDNPGGLSITLNGANPLTQECGTGFSDPGAVAVNGAGQSVPVTVSGTVNENSADTYTLTYTAVEGANSVSTTRTVNVVDTLPPVITLAGPNPLTVGCAQSFVDPGAMATDACAGAVSVTTSGTVDSNTPGTYTVTYTATDGMNEATATRTVVVSTEDDNPPVITLNGGNITLECGSTFTDPGATALDGCLGSVPINVSGTVDTHQPGNYTLTYTATDGRNQATATRNVEVVDTTPPVIALNGANPLTIECHTTFVDPGATATDGCAGTSPADASGTVDPNTPGTYTVTYTAHDASGNQAAPVTRTVNVVDTTPPVITLNGANPLTLSCRAPFVDPGATATDACSGSLPVTTSGTVNASVPGTYTVTYTATDGSHSATTTRTVKVLEDAPPVITVNGANPLTVECHTTFVDPGATASDACAGDLTGAIATSGSVNTSVTGTYTLTYSVSDGASTTTATRTVNVVDHTPPVINCPANIVTSLPLNSSATTASVNFSVTASDSCGSASVTTSPASGTAFPVGTTTVNVTATDEHGNTSHCQFTVTVLYNFAGFFSPVANLPTLNVVNAGRAVPVKFSLSGNKGLSIFAAAFPASAQIACDTNAPLSSLEETVNAGGSSLSYDPTSGQYNYVWKTDPAWAGTCRQLVLRLSDGTDHRANFKFR